VAPGHSRADTPFASAIEVLDQASQLIAAGAIGAEIYDDLQAEAY